MLQFDVCCEIIDHSFNCDCESLQGYANLHLLESPNPKIAIEKIWN